MTITIDNRVTRNVRDSWQGDRTFSFQRDPHRIPVDVGTSANFKRSLSSRRNSRRAPTRYSKRRIRLPEQNTYRRFASSERSFDACYSYARSSIPPASGKMTTDVGAGLGAGILTGAFRRGRRRLAATSAALTERGDAHWPDARTVGRGSLVHVTIAYFQNLRPPSRFVRGWLDTTDGTRGRRSGEFAVSRSVPRDSLAVLSSTSSIDSLRQLEYRNAANIPALSIPLNSDFTANEELMNHSNNLWRMNP